MYYKQVVIFYIKKNKHDTIHDVDTNFLIMLPEGDRDGIFN